MINERLLSLVVGIVLALGLTASVAVGSGTSEDGTESVPIEDAKLSDAFEWLEPTAWDRWPSSFAGLWLDRDGDSVTQINIAFTENADENVAELASDYPYPALLNPVTATYSYAELEAGLYTLSVDRNRAKESELEIPGIPTGDFDAAVDVYQNRLIVFAPHATEATDDWFNGRYEYPVEVQVEGLAQPSLCNTRDNCEPLRSGLEVIAPANDTRCSSGFAAERNGSGNDVIMSAGHCVGGSSPTGPQRSHNGTVFGSVLDREYEDNVDANIISVNNPFDDPVAKVFVDSSDKNFQINDGDTTWDALAHNDVVCMAGADSDGNCGGVIYKSFSPGYMPGDPTKMIKADYCSTDGDSGGGVYRNQSVHRAVGIQSGSHMSIGCHTTDAWSVFGHVEFARDVLNVTLLEL